jgi:hypothetical protein
MAAGGAARCDFAGYFGSSALSILLANARDQVAMSLANFEWRVLDVGVSVSQASMRWRLIATAVSTWARCVFRWPT